MDKDLKVNFKNSIPICYSYSRNRKIGILGGSFNPAHIGHIHITNTALINLGLDEIWWLVAPQNRLKSSLNMENFDKRLSYARLLTKNISYIKVLDLEKKNQLYATYKTVNFLNQRTRKVKFIWLMGSDILDNLNKWLYPNLIARNIHIAVISRPGNLNSFLNTSKVSNFGKKLKTIKSRIIFNKKKPVWVFLKNKLLSISSSEIRKTKTYT